MMEIFLIFLLGLGFIILRWSGATDKRGSIQEVGIVGVLAAIFGTMMFAVEGWNSGVKFLTGYAMEWSLSFDNLLAISMILNYFKLPKAFEPRILHWGLVSVAVSRVVATYLGNALFEQWERPAELFFAILILLTIGKLVMGGSSDAAYVDHNARWYVRSLRRWVRVTADVSSQVFFKKERDNSASRQMHWCATPLFTCLLAIEAADLMFSFDSIPAVLSVTHTDKLATFGAMMFAVMGLRAAYHIFDEFQRYFEYVPTAVAFCLTTIAIRMVMHSLFGVVMSPFTTLATVAVSLGLAVWLSTGDNNESKQKS
jgi:tellurite resistance protein TerC